MKKSQISNLESQVSKRGFSLVELIVVMAIIVLMTAVLLLNQNKNKAQSELEAAARQVAAQLRSLQNDALNGKMIEGDTYCRAIMKKSSDKKYTTYYEKLCGTDTDPVGSEQEFGLKNVVFDNNSFNNKVAFKSPTGWRTGDNKIVLISEKDGDKKMTICISDSGSITEEKGNADEDPNVCP